MRERKAGVSRSGSPALPCCPVPSHCRYVCPQPCRVTAWIRRPSQTPIPPSQPARASKAPSPASEVPHPGFSSSFILRKSKREMTVLLAKDPPTHHVRHCASCSCDFLSPQDHPCGRSYCSIMVEDAGLWEVKGLAHGHQVW